jgi:PHB/PHA accumulation regulator DNA-binding domain/Poly(hydroxyalcanoate) granule associated protein (phasin)
MLKNVTRKHVIKKYANRKLYDTCTSRYVTLGAVSELLRQGQEIEVIERETGRDLTSLILSQVVASEEKSRPAGITTAIPERGQVWLDYVRRALRGRAAQVTGELEERVDAAVEGTLSRLSIPSRRDLDLISRRLERLEREVKGLRASARGTNSRASSDS